MQSIRKWGHPGPRPELDTVWRVLGDEMLLEPVFVGDPLGVCGENRLQGGERPHGHPVDRGLAELVQRLGLVAGKDHVLGRAVVEEIIERADDRRIQVQKQHRPFEIAERRRPEPGFGPLPDGALGHEAGHLGQVETLHFRAHALARVGETHEPEGRRGMARDHVIKPVDVRRAVLGAPVDAHDLLHGFALALLRRQINARGHAFGKVDSCHLWRVARFSDNEPFSQPSRGSAQWSRRSGLQVWKG